MLQGPVASYYLMLHLRPKTRVRSDLIITSLSNDQQHTAQVLTMGVTCIGLNTFIFHGTFSQSLKGYTLCNDLSMHELFICLYSHR